MTRDASLDEFLGGDEADENDADAAGIEDAADGAADTTEDRAGNEDGDGSTGGDEAEAVDTTTEDGDVDGADAPDAGTDDEAADDSEWLPPDEVEPARSTYAWSPDGADCAACGATVERRWRDESGLVCADCKGW